MTSWAWADRRGQEAKLVQTRIHDWACTNVSVAKTKAREKEARQRKQGEKNDSESSWNGAAVSADSSAIK